MTTLLATSTTTSSNPATNLTTAAPTDNSDSTVIRFADLDLNSGILKALSDSGYTQPTPIQAQAIPPALQGRDLLLSAQTGSGKTAAFVLPVLERLNRHAAAGKANKAKPTTKALILTPTRELAMQVQDSVRRYGSSISGLYSVPLVGGAPYNGQIRALKKGVQIIVATPGRLIDHLSAGRVDLTDLDTLILDEADRMLDMGFADDITQILDAAPASRQTIMSSATWDGAVGKIAASFTTNPERVAIAVKTAHIDEKVYYCDNFDHKNQLVDRLLCDKDVEQAIVFTATKRSSEILANSLSEAGHKARYLHGDLPQGKRNRIVADLRAGKCDILVATDVAARGIDVPAISHVINYDLPRQVEDYVHRIGRCGRAGRTGVAHNLCSRDDHSQLKAIDRYLKRRMSEATVEGLEPKSNFADSSDGQRQSKGRGRNRNKSRKPKGGDTRYARGGYDDRKTAGQATGVTGQATAQSNGLGVGRGKAKPHRDAQRGNSRRNQYSQHSQYSQDHHDRHRQPNHTHSRDHWHTDTASTDNKREASHSHRFAGSGKVRGKAGSGLGQRHGRFATANERQTDRREGSKAKRGNTRGRRADSHGKSAHSQADGRATARSNSKGGNQDGYGSPRRHHQSHGKQGLYRSR